MYPPTRWPRVRPPPLARQAPHPRDGPAPSRLAQPAAYAASQAAQLQQRSRLGRRTSQEAGASKAADMGTCWFCSHRDRVKYALEWAQNIMFTLSVAVAALPLSWASTSRPAPAAFCSEAVPVWNTIVVLRTSTAAPPDGSSPGRQHAAILAPSPVKGTH